MGREGGGDMQIWWYAIYERQLKRGPAESFVFKVESRFWETKDEYCRRCVTGFALILQIFSQRNLTNTNWNSNKVLRDTRHFLWSVIQHLSKRSFYKRDTFYSDLPRNWFVTVRTPFASSIWCLYCPLAQHAGRRWSLLKNSSGQLETLLKPPPSRAGRQADGLYVQVASSSCCSLALSFPTR